ncbi:hypothetical protein M153_10400002425 [Pseudoloma neurophilia]|uniref:Uncharacterized protein n=1 Tax=Pseudoloma neurophilia TaxID=146866 RepID=A0A0R0M3D4_9MICR|nr:hypothetical protein M153_10400002425 [Pseudoloma neurophilia]
MAFIHTMVFYFYREKYMFFCILNYFAKSIDILLSENSLNNLLILKICIPLYFQRNVNAINNW